MRHNAGTMVFVPIVVSHGLVLIWIPKEGECIQMVPDIDAISVIT